MLLDEQADVLRESVKWPVQQLMEADVSELIGAERGERRPDDRVTHRKGYRRDMGVGSSSGQRWMPPA